MGEAIRDFEATDLVEAYKMLSGHETAILATNKRRGRLQPYALRMVYADGL